MTNLIIIIKVLLGLQRANKGGAGEERDLNIGCWEDFGLPDKDVDYDVADDVDVDEDEDEDEEDDIEKEEWDEILNLPCSSGRAEAQQVFHLQRVLKNKIKNITKACLIV